MIACVSAFAALLWFSEGFAFINNAAVPATNGELKEVPDALPYVPPGNVLITYSPGAAIQTSVLP